MAKAISPTKQHRYVLACDRALPKSKRTVWILRPLSHKVMADAQDNLVEHEMVPGKADSVRAKVLSGTRGTTVLLNGIDGVENYFDEDGTAVTMPPMGKNPESDMRLRFLDYVPTEDKDELIRALLDRSLLTEGDEGNFDSQSESRSNGLSTAQPSPEATASAP